MPRLLTRVKEQARTFFLTGELETNAEIGSRLRIKPHTVAKWRREGGWDDMKIKIDRRASEMMAEKLASDRVSLNVRHYRMWDLVLAKLAEGLKERPSVETRELERVSAILNRAQQGQRLAKGLSLTGETEEQIRAQFEAENRRLIDTFVDTVKECVPDEETRDRIRLAILRTVPEEDEPGALDAGAPLDQ